MGSNFACLEWSPKVLYLPIFFLHHVYLRRIFTSSGLAQASVHADTATSLIPASLFEFKRSWDTLDETAARLKSFMLSGDAKPASPGLHTFSILARVLKDPELGTMVEDETGIYIPTMKRFGETVKNLVDQWRVDTTNPQDVERKIEELSWMNVMIFGIGGWKKDKPFNADFFA